MFMQSVQRARRYWRSYRTNEILVWALCAFLPIFVAADETEPREAIVLIGASYARSWPVDSIAGQQVLNRGIGGNQSFEMLARFRSDALAANPGSIVIWGFINDIFRSEPERMEQTLDRIKSSFEQMYEQAAAEGVEVILATEVTIREPKGVLNFLAGFVGQLLNRPSYQAYINDHVLATNAWLKDFAKQRELILLDFQSVLSDSNGRRRAEYAADDGSHLSESAYRALSDYTDARTNIPR
jgi:lysophospholipase L1-like esterase